MGILRWHTVIPLLMAVAFGLLVGWNPPVAAASLAVAGAGTLAFRYPGAATVSLLFAGALFLRPGALGLAYTPVGLAIVTVAGMTLFLHRWPIYDTVTPRIGAVPVAVAALWGYLVLHASLVGVERFDDVVKAMVAHLLVAAVGYLILRHRDMNRLFARVVVWSLVMVAASYAITFTLALMVPLDQLAITRIPIPNFIDRNDIVGTIYFPTTVLYNTVPGIDARLLRLMGWAREAGILQAFFIWALFSYRPLGITGRWIAPTLIFGVIVTFSTAGAVVLPATVAVWFLVRRSWHPAMRGTAMGLMAAGAGAGLVYAPVVGLAEKSQSNAISIVERVLPASQGASGLIDHLGGTGLYSGTGSKQAGISLIAQAPWLGLVGILLVAATWAAACHASEDRRTKLVALFPILLTAAASQPLLDAPMLVLVMMVNYPLHECPCPRTVRRRLHHPPDELRPAPHPAVRTHPPHP